MIAFVSGKRILVDQVQRTVRVQGKIHVDEYPWSKVRDRVKLYADLSAKYAGKAKAPYAASLAAAQRAADMVAQAKVAAHETS